MCISFGVLAMVFAPIAVVAKRKRDEYDIISHKWDRFDNTRIAFSSLTIFCVSALLSCSIATPVSLVNARIEYEEFLLTKEIVQEAYENGTELDNISITQTIIEKNEWLTKVKVNKKTKGIWSVYYYIDVDNIEPIRINNGEYDCEYKED
jgi:hypothetical protein